MIHDEDIGCIADGRIFVHYLTAIMLEFIHYADIFIIRERGEKKKPRTAAAFLDLPLATYLCVTFNLTQRLSLSIEKVIIRN